MTIYRSKKFEKQYKKLPVAVKKQFKARLQLFVLDQTHPSLKLHPLKGELNGLWSMNVNGDFRAIYKIQNGAVYIFEMIGSHSQLYG